MAPDVGEPALRISLTPPFNQGPFVSPDPPANVRADPRSGFVLANPKQIAAGHAHIYAGVGSSFAIPAGAGGTLRAFANPHLSYSLKAFALYVFGGSHVYVACTLYLATGRDGWASTNYEFPGLDGHDMPLTNPMSGWLPGGITTLRSRADPSRPDWGAAFLVVEADAGAWVAASAEASVSTIADLISIDSF